MERLREIQAGGEDVLDSGEMEIVGKTGGDRIQESFLRLTHFFFDGYQRSQIKIYF